MSRTAEELCGLPSVVVDVPSCRALTITPYAVDGHLRVRFGGDIGIATGEVAEAVATLLADAAEARAEVAALLAAVDAMAARCRAQEAVIQEHDDAKEAAYAEVAALRQEHEAEANAWEREVDVARHQIATLREHVKLMREWQAAKRAEEQLLRLQTTAEFGELATARCAWEAAAVAREAIEARMLAEVLPKEVGRG